MMMRICFFGLILVLLLLSYNTANATELKLGDTAPDFSLLGSDIKTYSLSELKGTVVVLAWFPKAFTGG